MDYVPQINKLYRSRKDSMIAGVCGGLGERYHMDSTWVRIFFILLFFMGGFAFLMYVLLWIIVPLSPES